MKARPKIAVQIGRNVKRLRNELGLTQKQLAKLVGVTLDTVSNLETGRTVPGVYALERMAAQLKVPLRDLFDDTVPDGAQEAASPHADTVRNALRLLSDESVEILAGLARTLEAVEDKRSEP